MEIQEELRVYLTQNGAKPSTIKQHCDTLGRLLREVGSISPEAIIVYLRSKYSTGSKGKYLNHTLNTLRVIDRMKGTSIYSSLPFFKEIEPMKSTMSDEEIEAFLNLPPVQRRQVNRSGIEHTSIADPKGYERWTLFFSIMAFTGARPGEVANLSYNSVDFGRSIFVLQDTKTNEPRFIPIPPNIREKVRVYVDKVDGKYLFPSRRHGKYKGDVVDSVDWGYNFHTRIKRLGIKRDNLSPYSLRHSLITRLLEEDVNLFKVQKMVGHRRLETTAHYTHLTTKDLVETIKKHPLVRKSTEPAEIIRGLMGAIQAFSLDRDPRFNYEINQSDNSLILRLKIRN